MRRLLIGLSFLLALRATGQSTIDTFMAAPSASGLAVSADGKQMAWILNDKGKRNIVLRQTSGQVKQLTNYDQDDGQELSQLTFSPDGSRLVFVRGGDLSREGYSPNPASLAEGAEQAIWCINLTNNDFYKLTLGSDPVFFPDGNQLLFSKGPQIQTIAIEKGTAKTLFFARGNNGDPRFSPDGKEILFVSNRRDHNFIGVYNLAANKVRWLAPEVSLDQLARWSPDGKRVAFIRMPGLQAEELISFVGGRKFAVWVVDAVTGAGGPIWTSPADDGGFAQFYPNTPIAWTKTDRILFFSEHEGWNHVYSIKPDGSDLKDITPGPGEVESYTTDASGANIYFDGNREDIDRRHIWKSGVAEGKPQQMTSGAGIEMYPALVNGELYCIRSGVKFPTNVSRVGPDGKKFEPISTVSDKGTAVDNFVIPEQVIFKAADGTTVHGQLFINKNIKGKRPAVVFMHGGPIRQMLLGFHYSGYYSNCYAFNQYLADAGYAVLAVNFRDGIGYGQKFRRAENQGPWGASEYQDVVAAGQFLQRHQDVDAQKIGLWGGSYGGYLTAMGLARNPELFKVGVDLHGVHDWGFRAREFSPGGGWGITSKDMETATRNSPVSDLSKWTGPVLLVCGDDDRNVLFWETTDLAEKLRARKVPVDILVLPDEVHGFLRYESWSKVFEAGRKFFDKHLKK